MQINSHDFSMEFIRLLSSKAFIGSELLLLMNGQRFVESWGEEMFSELRRTYRCKFCPLCIQEINYHKHIWMYKPVTICLEHQVLLIDQCDKCHKNVIIKDLIHGCCGTCGAIYKLFKTTNIPKESLVLSSQRFIYSLLNGDEPCTSICQKNDFAEYMTLAKYSFYLLEGLDSFDPSCPGKIENFRNKKMGHQDNEKFTIAMSNLFWMYQNFPVNFNKVLEEHAKKPLKVRTYQSNQFVKLFGATFSHISLAYREFRLLQKREEEQTIINRMPTEKMDQQNTLQQAKSRKKQNCQVKHNIIVGNTLPKNLDGYMTRMEASHLLGIGIREQVNAIIEAGFLSLYNYPGNKWLLKKSDIRNFLNRYSGTYIEGEVIGRRFHEVLNIFSQRGLNLVRLLQFIRDQKLTPYHNRHNINLADCYFLDEQIETCLPEILREKQLKRGYTLQEISKMLKLERKTVKKLTEHQIFEPVKIVTYKDGRQNYFFSRIEVDDFVNNLITIPEAVNNYNVSEWQLRYWMREGMLSDKLIGFGKKYLVDKRQVEELLTKSIDTDNGIEKC